jgi:hypothetical protein
MENELVQATWWLVLATGLLALASIVPLVRDILDRREQRRRIGAALVPDMMILLSRLEGAEGELAASRSRTNQDINDHMSEQDIKDRIVSNDEELKIINSIIMQGARPSLVFVNELYLVRHLISQAQFSLIGSLTLTNKTDVKNVQGLVKNLNAAHRAYAAAVQSLKAAVGLLPSKVRTVKGEDFWHRLDRLSNARETEAEKSFVNREPLAVPFNPQNSDSANRGIERDPGR